jgi:DNA mismatch repair protein MutS
VIELLLLFPKLHGNMIQVRDLKLKDEVLPFFNFTNNENSENYLFSLLKDVPEQEALIRQRQATVQGFIDNWHILENFTYRKLDLKEVHAHLEEIANKTFDSKKSKIAFTLKLQFSETKRSRLWSRLVQMILFINEIKRQYLSRLDKSKFPDNFKRQLQSTLSFINNLRLERNEELINENCFTVPKMIEFTQLLSQLDPVDIKSFWDFFFSFEAYWSIAKSTLANGFSFPRFSNDEFRLDDFFHPAIKKPVKNTLNLKSTTTILLLTGPNMSGKSTLLKSIGLCVYLAHVGFTVPASSCIVPYFNSIALAINLSDSLKDGYSHFMAELDNLKKVINAAKSSGRCFAVFDEIFKGTNTEDALEITKSTISGLSKVKDSFFLISTHILQLDEYLNNNCNERIKKYHITCLIDKGIPRFTYKLEGGWSQLKIGRILFDMKGLSELLES